MLPETVIRQSPVSYRHGETAAAVELCESDRDRLLDLRNDYAMGRLDIEEDEQC